MTPRDERVSCYLTSRVQVDTGGQFDPRDQSASCYLTNRAQVDTGRSEWLLEIKLLVVI